MASMWDYLTYDSTAPARDVLISLAELYNTRISYLNNNAITKAEIWKIYDTELTAALKDKSLGLDSPRAILWFTNQLKHKYRALLASLQDFQDALFRDLFTKAAVEHIECEIIYERRDGRSKAYLIRPYEYEPRTEGDFAWSGKVMFGRTVGTRSFLALGISYIYLTGDRFTPEYPLSSEMTSYYDLHNLADLLSDEEGFLTDILVMPDVFLFPSEFGRFPAPACRSRP